MNKKETYRTEQKDIILRCLKECGEHITAKQLEDNISKAGFYVGQATIYRCLNAMTADGTVTKYIIDEKSPACYEFTGSSKEIDEYHCRCEKYGRLIHLHCDEVEKLQEHISKCHGFTVDPTRTVFYGICAQCAEKEKGNH